MSSYVCVFESVDNISDHIRVFTTERREMRISILNEMREMSLAREELRLLSGDKSDKQTNIYMERKKTERMTLSIANEERSKHTVSIYYHPIALTY